jgi:hypothetical protein
MLENLSQWITQKEASELTGKSLQSICQLVRLKRVRSEKIYGKRLVHCRDILNYKPIKSGRPKKNES